MKDAYAVINKNEKVRMQSSSGGTISLLAQKVIENGGIVYGVENRVQDMHFIGVNCLEDIVKIRGSKYVRVSNFKDVINQIEKNISNNTFFMFVGTPCQVNVIKSITEKSEYDNCLLIDLICHGVMNAGIYNKYLEWVEKKYGERIASISFRDKEKGWKEQRWKIILSSGKCVEEQDTDLLKNIYNCHYAHDESCLNCAFTNLDRVGDLTIGDLWGVEKDKSIKDDNKGINIVLVNSEIGLKSFNDTINDAWIKRIDLKYYLQPQLKENIKTKISERNLFLKEIDNFDRILKIMFDRKIRYRVIRNIKLKLSAIKGQ